MTYPTPPWHMEARALYAGGMKPADIGRKLCRDYSAVRHAVGLRRRLKVDARASHAPKDPYVEHRLTRYPRLLPEEIVQTRRERILQVCKDWLDGKFHRSQLHERIREVQA